MSSAGMGGMGDTDTTDPFGMRNESNLNGMPSEREMAGDTPLGTDPTLGGELPPDTVEVVEVVTGPGDIPDDALYGLDMYADDGTGRAGGFRWRYVPMAAVPLTVGGAAFWFARRRKTPSRALYDTMTRSGGDALDYLREQTKRAPEATSALREKTAAVVGALVAADLVSRAQERLATARDLTRDQQRARTRLGFRGRRTVPLRENPAGQLTELSDVVRPIVAWWLATLPLRRRQQQKRPLLALLLATPLFRRTSRAMQMRQQTQRRRDKMPTSAGAVVAATTNAAAKVSKGVMPVAAKATAASTKTRQAVRQTGQNVKSAWKRTRAFGFGLFVTAMVTYIAIWRRRMAERDMRETASGQLEPGREPTFSR
jgi:hypothetical protein